MFNIGEEIYVRLHSGIYKFVAVGHGLYPWHCSAEIDHPNDMIFENRYGVWFYESELDEISHGIYKVNGTRRNQRNKEFLD